ncbi:unnamed protein product [Orchesella dallaii]|uniref:Uncharacterized protein n=1 Tax=Orchesella dallaii TaxID=48710 RepID=A0ABP1S6V1_9HEXA
MGPYLSSNKSLTVHIIKLNLSLILEKLHVVIFDMINNILDLGEATSGIDCEINSSVNFLPVLVQLKINLNDFQHALKDLGCVYNGMSNFRSEFKYERNILPSICDSLKRLVKILSDILKEVQKKVCEKDDKKRITISAMIYPSFYMLRNFVSQFIR